MKKQILLIEDEAGLRLTLGDRLESEGYLVEEAETGPQGLQLGRTNRFDLLILDIMLPGMDGFTICKQLRTEKIDTPIIMLTAKSLLQDKVSGLRLGADDYLTKPFEMPEFLARVEVQLRRGEAAQKAQPISRQPASKDLIIDLKRGYSVCNGIEHPLLAQEIKLLDYFYQNEGKVVSREDLLAQVWGYESNINTRTVDVHIARLRQKIGDTDDVPHCIHTVRGIGYKFTSP